ncbi:hypothetical protein [Antrihabitans spumae]|uniref:Thioesterase domain-containing protein n=1 Tax=Antrihabitans spumae TaxID=3373370 RepID=A0ABW7KNT5_9NOCA
MIDRIATQTTELLGQLTIDSRFNGPPASANGGYACGRIAAFVDGPSRVTLRKPPPLETELSVHRDDDGIVRVVADGVVYAEVRSIDPGILIAPARPTIAEAEAARNRHPGNGIRHLLSDCFVCGPERSNGLHVSPGILVGHDDVTASPFVPDATVGDADGVVPSEIVWAAVDCSSYPAVALQSGPICLLGQLSVVQRRPIHVGDQLVAVGWTLAVSGRKYRTAAALVDTDGVTVAQSEAVWIALTSGDAS